jgi:iron complex outermembrane recepter protein
MRIWSKSILCLVIVGFLATGWGRAAVADTTLDTTPSSSRGDSLEEVVVTARRREENSQSVPISVTAFSQKDMDEKNIHTMNDLQYSVPSLTVGGVGAGFRDNPQVNLRGQGVSAAGQNGVVQYFDEVPVPVDRFGQTGLIGGPGMYFDMDSVQVLKGPQGTLFGRNATGGALLLQTKKPTDAFGGYIEVAAGNYNDREISGALNLPLFSDTLLVRIAASGKTRDGFTRSLGTPSDPNGGLMLDNQNYSAERISVTYRPTTEIDNEFVYSGLSSHNNGTSDILTYVDPNGPAAALYPGLLQALAAQQKLGPRTQLATSVDPKNNRDSAFITDIFSYQISSNLKFRNIFGYMKSRINESLDLDGSPYPIQDYPPYLQKDDTEQFTEEAQLQGISFDQKLSWTVGAFYLNLPAKPYVYVPQDLLGVASVISHEAAERSVAGYAQGTYDLSSWVDGLKATAGVRYTSDYEYSLAQSLNANAQCTVPPPPNTDQNCASLQKGHFHAPTWTLGLDDQITPKTLIYLASRRGYHSGGFNLFGDPSAGHFSVGPEYVTDEELGVKSDWSIGDTQGRTNVAIYHQAYTAIQIGQTILSPTGVPEFIIANAANASIWGAEFEATVNVTRDFQVGGFFDWLDFRYKNFEPGVDVAYAEATKTDQRPPIKFGLNTRYRLPLDESIGEISASATYAWQSRNGDHSQVGGIQDEFGILNLNLNWDHIARGPVDATFFMTNVTNKTYVLTPNPFASSFGYSTSIYGEPRMYGIRLKYSFGGEAGH